MDAYMARLVLAARGRGRRVGGASVHPVARAGNLLAWPRERLRQLVAQPCPPGSWKPDIVLQASCIDEAETLLVPHHSRGDHWALVEGECPPHLFFYLQTLDPHPPNPRPPTPLPVDSQGRCIRYYDSLPRQRKEQFKEATAAVARFLDAAGVARFSNVMDWPRQLVSSCPRQANGDDCGAFALMAAQQLAFGIR